MAFAITEKGGFDTFPWSDARSWAQTFACTIYEDTFGKGMMFDELGQTDRFHRCLDRKQDVANQVLSTGCFKIWSTISQTIRGPTSTNADSSGWVCSYLIHRILLKRIDLQVPHIPKMYLHVFAFVYWRFMPITVLSTNLKNPLILLKLHDYLGRSMDAQGTGEARTTDLINKARKPRKATLNMWPVVIHGG